MSLFVLGVGVIIGAWLQAKPCKEACCRGDNARRAPMRAEDRA